MDTIVNLLIICFILGMAYLWSVYGLFSAFLQLIVVIAAGSFTLAIWETVAIDLGLLDRMGQPGWGVALLGPFVLTLILMRVVCDVLVRQNAHYPRLVQSIGGAVCGTMSAILIVGFAWIGISFLPLGPDVMGIQPYSIPNPGQVADNDDGGRLWFAYDHMAAGFFNGLSGGAFATRHPLHLYQPQLAKQAETFRLHTGKGTAVKHARAFCDYVVAVSSYLAQSDEQKMGLVQLVFNLKTGAMIDGMVEQMRHMAADEAGAADIVLTDAQVDRLTKILAGALNLVMPERIDSFLASMRRRLRRDIKNIGEYYESLRREMEHGLDRAGLSDQLITDRREKIAMLPEELTAKRNDLLKKYSVRVTIAPADRKSTRLNSSHTDISRMPSSA